MRKMQRLKMFRKLKHYAVTNDGTLTNINIFMEKIQKKKKNRTFDRCFAKCREIKKIGLNK